MRTPDDRWKELPWLTNNSIPPANPADLKTLWKLQKDLEARYGRQGVIMGIGLDQQGVLSPGANRQGLDIPSGYRSQTDLPPLIFE